MTRIRAIVSDLDGTFWWGEETLHPSTMVAVTALRAQGVDLLFATGRRYASARKGLAPLGLAGPTVLLSGAVGADLTSGAEWHREGFTADDGMAVLSAFRAEGLEPVVYVCDADVDVLTGEGCATSDAHQRNLGRPAASDPEPAIRAGRAVGFGVCGIDPVHARASSRISEAIVGVAQGWAGPDHVMGGWTLLAGPRGVSKVSGIQGWCDARGLGPDEVMAVGDGANDVEMLDWAGVSVAVTGGAAEAHGTDHTIAMPQDGGWSTLLDLL